VQRRLTFVAIVTVSLLIIACGRKEASPIVKATDDCPFRSDKGRAGPGTVQLLATLSKMNLANPIADLDSNLFSGDRRFIGINSYSCAEPGIGNGDHEVVDRFHTHCLEGTGDVIEGSLHWALTDAATAYALKYNMELLLRIRTGIVS
jgi:hypothetical protein